jgi:hypothetical protein
VKSTFLSGEKPGPIRSFHTTTVREELWRSRGRHVEQGRKLREMTTSEKLKK